MTRLLLPATHDAVGAPKVLVVSTCSTMTESKRNAIVKLLCEVYSGPASMQMYLFVSKKDGLSRVPETLLQRFGKPKLAMTMILHKGRKLAKVEVEKVIEAIEQQGFYLQMQSSNEEYMQEINQYNDKLPRS